MELTVFRGAVIHVKFEHGVKPYFDILMPRLMKQWRKKRFNLRNDTSMLLPMFIESCPIPLPSWGAGWIGRTSASCSPCVRPFSSCSWRG
jgi:hypothetical protein